MNPSVLMAIGAGAVAGIIVAALAFSIYVRRQRRVATGIMNRVRADASQLREDAERLRTDAARDAERLRSDAALTAKAESLKLREDAEKELSRRREEFERQERRTEKQGKELDQKLEEIRSREREFGRKQEALSLQEAQLRERTVSVDKLEEQQRQRLERIAGLTTDEARRELMQRVEEEARSQASALARDIKEQARRSADRDARRIISMAVQRLAAEHTSETTVSTVTLPNDEMKGRIIGREGRNIRAFETATGVDVIIDDTPDTVVISCFDPVRREVARRSLELLIQDGRIHPGRIEELVEKCRHELEGQLVELGEQAAFETGINGLHPELVKLIGRMRYRTSYGQNILDHSKEVAWLAGMMAAELKLDVALSKRGGLLHDVGKVLTHDHEGTHVQLGVEVARRYGETEAVINCIEAHHDDVPHDSSESVLVQAADAISGARPGARREAFETYVKRLTRLEEIANDFPGVEKTNVIQAGREVRVIVTPDRVDDAAAALLSEAIAKRIEGELQYPGQIRVVVIRETRSVGVAK